MNSQNSRSRRKTSGTFSQLSPNQVRRLKEAYYLLDNDGDGNISFSDLNGMLVSLGKSPSKEDVEDMLSQMPRPLTFSSFLTVMSETLGKVTPANDLMNSFSVFEDENDSGSVGSSKSRIRVDELRDMLIEGGMASSDIDSCFRPFLKTGGLDGEWFKYKDFVQMLSASDLDE